jgi:hypothetical protein
MLVSEFKSKLRPRRRKNSAAASSAPTTTASAVSSPVRLTLTSATSAYASAPEKSVFMVAKRKKNWKRDMSAASVRGVCCSENSCEYVIVETQKRQQEERVANSKRMALMFHSGGRV